MSPRSTAVICIQDGTEYWLPLQDPDKAKSARQNRMPEQEETRDEVNLKQDYEQKYLWEIHRSVDTE